MMLELTPVVGPDMAAVGALDEHAHHAGGAAAVDDAHLEIAQAHALHLRIKHQQRLPERQVQRVHGAVALSGVDLLAPIHAYFDVCLGAALVALVARKHVEIPHLKIPFAHAQRVQRHQVEAAVGALVGVAAQLAALEPLGHELDARVVPADIGQRRLRRAYTPVRPTCSLSRKRRWLPTASGEICSKLAASFTTPSMCMPPLCAKAL